MNLERNSYVSYKYKHQLAGVNSAQNPPQFSKKKLLRLA